MFGMDFFSALSEEKLFLVVSVGVLMVMDTYFGNALILPLFISVRVLSFMISCFVIRALGLGVFFGMVGYLLLLGASPWAASVDDIACARLERLFGSYSEGVCREWVPSDHFVDSVASSDVSGHLDVWTDGSFVLDFDGDLLTVIERMIHQRGVRSVRISKVKGHADDDMVAVGRVRVEDRVGKDLADRAADFGRRRVSDFVMDVRGRFLSACSSWYPVILELHRFFIAIARAAVNEGGCAGIALHPTVWSSGGLIKRRKVRVSAWEYTWVPGPTSLWRHGSIGWPCIAVRDVDVGFWPYCVGLLVKFCSFLSSLHWPSTVDDLGVGGVSFVELLILVLEVVQFQ